MERINLLDLSAEQLAAFAAEQKLPAYRAGQIRKWLFEGVSFEEMTNLPLPLRRKLLETADVGRLKVYRKFQSREDETCKYLFDLGDGNVIESVLMKYKYGYSVCLSSQVGCRMGCTFCASAGLPYSRNLTMGEMLSQIVTINRDQQIRIGHVVLMGIGEPLDNYENVLRFLREVQREDCLGIGFRKISLSTCGLVPGILRLAEENLPITLSVSLHSPFQKQREEMMPVARKYTLDKLMEACNSYVAKTGRRITFEYAMILGVNDTAEHAKALISLTKGLLCHINLIPVNPIPGQRYQRSSRDSIEAFSGMLEKRGISATVRRELGQDIRAACGQLRRDVVNS